MPRTSSGILLLRKEERSISHNNSHLSLGTEEQTCQTHYKHHNQANTRAISPQSTLHLRITLKLQKQSCLCSLSANSHFPRAFLPKPIPLPSLHHMQTIQKLRPDL